MIILIGVFARSHARTRRRAWSNSVLVVPQADLVARLGREPLPQRRVLGDRSRGRPPMSGGANGVRAEEEAIGIAVDQRGGRRERRPRRGDVVRDDLPRDVEIEIRQRRIAEHRREHRRRDPAIGRTVRPRPVCAQMIVVVGCRSSSAFICARYSARSGSDGRFSDASADPASRTARPCRCAGSTTRPASAGEREDAVERRIESGSPCRRRTFADTNSLWIVNSPMPVKTPGNVSQHAPDVVGRVHVAPD